MSQIKSSIQPIIKQLIQSYYRVGIYALITRLIFVAITVPVLTQLLNNMISLWANSTSSKATIASLLFSPLGLFYFTLIVFLVLIISFVELQGLMIMLSQTKTNEQHTLFTPLWNSGKKVIKPGFFTFLLTLFAFTFHTTIVIGLLYFPTAQIPNYFIYFIFTNPYSLAIFVIFAVGSYVLLSRYLFLFIYLPKTNTLKEAISISVQETKGRRIKIILMIMMYQVILLLIGLSLHFLPFALSFVLSFLRLTNIYFVSLLSVMIFITKVLLTLIFYSLAYPLLISAIVKIDHHKMKRNQSINAFDSQRIIWLRHILYRGGVVLIATYLIVQSQLVSFHFPMQARVTVVASNDVIDGIQPNSKRHMEHAISIGANQVEVEVKMTKDGALVLSNTSLVKDGEETKLIEDLLYSDLKKLTHEQEPFMTLEEAILISINRIHLNIIYQTGEGGLMDPKRNLTNRDTNILQKIAYLIQIHGQSNNSSILSSNIHVPTYLQLLVPNITSGIITPHDKKIPTFISTDISQVHEDKVTQRHISLMHLQGKQVFVYGAQSIDQFAPLAKQHVTAIVTNKVQDALRLSITFQEQ